MFQDEQRMLLEKYERSIEAIIKKYEDVDDRYDSVIDIDEYEGAGTPVCSDVSFIRQSSAKTRTSEGIIGFEEVYLRLCCPCDFDDIAGFFR